MQKSTGMRISLSSSKIYDFFSKFRGDHRSRTVFIDEFVIPAGHSGILDLGCGVSEILSLLPDNVKYVGFDPRTKKQKVSRRMLLERPPKKDK